MTKRHTPSSTRPVVLVPMPLPGSALEANAERFDAIELWKSNGLESILDEVGSDVRGIATNGHYEIGSDLMDRLPKLEIISNLGVGVDRTDLAAAHDRGVVVTNTAGSLDDAVAEIALAMVLMTVRELPQAGRFLRGGHWQNGPYPLVPTTVAGRSLGVLGLGHIGQAVARRAEAFGLRVAYHNRSRRNSSYTYFPELIDLARAVDILVVSVTGGEGTRHLVNQGVLEALGEDGILINVSRGSVVDQEALIRVLRAGTIRGAGLDVFADEPHVPDELLTMPQVVLTPHVGSATESTRRAMADLCIANLVSWFDTGTPLTPVLMQDPESEDSQ